MPQAEVKPTPSPETPFTVASGPMTSLVGVKEVADGVEVSVREAKVVLPTTMALNLARLIINIALGDRHA